MTIRPVGLHPRRARTPAPLRWLAAAGLALAGCTLPGPTGRPAIATCVDAGAPIAQLAWSQTGAFLAVGTVDATGRHSARVLTPSGVLAAEPISEPGMLAGSVVVSAGGRLAWLSDDPDGRRLVEDTAGGGSATWLPAGVTAIGWTAIGYALLQPGDDGSRVLLLDVERPDAPTTLYETELVVERLWISADPEFLLLTIVHPDHRDTDPTYMVVGPSTQVHLQPPGADTTGASMPMLRRKVVFHSTISGRMEIIAADGSGEPIQLSSQAAIRGMISDRGILALAAADAPGSLCLVDVAALLD